MPVLHYAGSMNYLFNHVLMLIKLFDFRELIRFRLPREQITT